MYYKVIPYDTLCLVNKFEVLVSKRKITKMISQSQGMVGQYINTFKKQNQVL